MAEFHIFKDDSSAPAARPTGLTSRGSAAAASDVSPSVAIVAEGGEDDLE